MYKGVAKDPYHPPHYCECNNDQMSNETSVKCGYQTLLELCDFGIGNFFCWSINPVLFAFLTDMSSSIKVFLNAGSASQTMREDNVG